MLYTYIACETCELMKLWNENEMKWIFETPGSGLTTAWYTPYDACVKRIQICAFSRIFEVHLMLILDAHQIGRDFLSWWMCGTKCTQLTHFPKKTNFATWLRLAFSFSNNRPFWDPCSLAIFLDSFLTNKMSIPLWLLCAFDSLLVKTGSSPF